MHLRLKRQVRVVHSDQSARKCAAIGEPSTVTEGRLESRMFDPRPSAQDE
ncbi:MAG: hypothetical protein R3F49_07750 [Planctomycetota bacterium]